MSGQPSRFGPIPKDKIAYITFSGPINGDAERNLISGCSDAIGKGARTIYLMISTPGGSVLHGMNLYSMLRALPVRLIAHNIASVDSIGTIVFLAAGERYASPHATFLFHGASRNFTKGAALNRRQLEHNLDALTIEYEKIAAVIHSRASFRSRDEVFSLIDAQSTQDANFAKSKGIIHGTRGVKIPPKAFMHYILPGPAEPLTPQADK